MDVSYLHSISSRVVRSTLLTLPIFFCSEITYACSDQEMLQGTKSVAASKIEAGLPDSSFESWLEKPIGASVGKWEVNDCGEQTGEPTSEGRDYPLCVDLIAKLPSDEYAFIRLSIGSFSKCAPAVPKVSWVQIWSSADPVQHTVIKELRSLNEFVAYATRAKKE